MYIKNEYHAYGNLNGYTLCYTIHPYGTSDFTKGKYSVDGYTFQCYSDVGLSRVCLYLYRDNEFITFEDGYKRGLFDLEDAYELIKNNPYQKPITGTVEYPPIKYVTVHTVEKAEIPQQNYVTEMTDKMAGEFFDPEVFVGVTQSVLATAKDYYHAYGNLNGYTLCYVANRMCASNFLEKKYTAGDYIFYNKLPSYPSEISLYLYRDNTFVPFEAAYEQGIFDPKDAYELIIGNPSTADPGASCIRAEKAKESSGENSEPDYVTEMTDEMADLFLTSVYKYQIPELRISLGNNDFKEYLLEQYLVKYTYYAYGNLNGYTLFTAYGMETNDMAIAKYRAGDYIFEAPCHGTASFVFLYLYRDNEIITFEDAYERGLFDPKDAYELMVNNPPSGEIVKTIRVHAEKAED